MFFFEYYLRKKLVLIELTKFIYRGKAFAKCKVLPPEEVVFSAQSSLIFYKKDSPLMTTKKIASRLTNE